MLSKEPKTILDINYLRPVIAYKSEMQGFVNGDCSELGTMERKVFTQNVSQFTTQKREHMKMDTMHTQKIFMGEPTSCGIANTERQNDRKQVEK